MCRLSQEFPGYGPTVCLVKRWLRAQMLDDELFPDIPLELIVASEFISPEPFTVVLQPQAAFLRVLSVLANRNWCLEPVIINFNRDLTREYFKIFYDVCVLIYNIVIIT